ncbi:MAG TPA: glutamate synthase-related protein [Dehalococcoidales bacterium]|nr:glutamate synthase-related protein [Dehalococcoidales bacterium]
MPKKFHIHTKKAVMDFDYIFKFKITRGENCINCGKCTKVCIYEAHKRSKDDPRKMADPNTVVCRNCFRCIQECPRGALEKSIEKEFASVGGSYWKADNLLSLWKQAEDGAVPVSGAGYRGPFTGAGFDGMWTDMSEIVRPTRDGIHGREYINTGVTLGRKLNHLVFKDDGQLASAIPPTIDIPLPILFDINDDDLSPVVKETFLEAALEIGTFVIMPASDITPALGKYQEAIIPALAEQDIDKYESLIKKARLVSIDFNEKMLNGLPALMRKISKIGPALTFIRVPAVKNVESTVAALAHAGAEIIHIVADYRGEEINGASGSKRLLRDIIRASHMKLVDDSIRDEVTLIASGGISMAEQVPKSMLCGADLTAVDIPLMVAIGMRLYEQPQKMVVWPKDLDKVSPALLVQRVINLIGAWHSQILEMMGAMGIREARRLRGETGRAIFFEEIDRDTFQKLFKTKAEKW